MARFSKVRTGWQFTKSSWAILRSEKELSVFPVFSILLMAAVLIPFFVYFGTNPAFAHRIAGQQVYSGRGLVAWIIALLVLNVGGNFFGGAVLHGAMMHFKGGRPTFKSSLRAAVRKFPQLALFSLYTGSVGIVLSLLEQRLPFIGKLFAWLANLGWAVANFFSLATIMFTKRRVMPLEATKTSATLVKKVWGEGVVASTSLGIIFLLAMFGLMTVWGLGALGAITVLSLGKAFFIGWSVVSAAVYVVLLLLCITLSGILNAALYYYAKTGQAPAPFDAQTLHRAIRPKRQRKLFAR